MPEDGRTAGGPIAEKMGGLALDRARLQKFMSAMKQLDGKDLLIWTVAHGAAPTLKGIKPSNLISFSRKGRDLYGLWEEYKQQVSEYLGLRYYELRRTGDQQLVLFYRCDLLGELLREEKTSAFLSALGYSGSMTLDESLQRLRERFEGKCPHEIGIFLGIPVEDVNGFMKHKGEGCLLCGYWKVYHDPESARSRFKAFDRARANVMETVALSLGLN